MSVIFVFLDGIGLAPAGPDNPLSTAPTPVLRALLGGPLTSEQVPVSAPVVATVGPPALLFRPIDATFGVAGLPQSGTGQTALLAGANAAALHGRHQPHFPPVALRPLLAERSIFRRVAVWGGRTTFANAFTADYWEALAARRLRRSASVVAAEGAGLRFRDLDDLRRGRALAWDITGVLMRGRPGDLAPVTPAAAGANLARLAYDYDLVFFECFLPDLAGHGRLTLDGAADQQPSLADAPVQNTPAGPGPQARPPIAGQRSTGQQIDHAMALIDSMLGGVLAAKRPGDTLLVTSDHGNIESYAAPAHTRNPVPLLAVGPGATAFAAVHDLTGIADALERVVG
jgi:hypothetical protein